MDPPSPASKPPMMLSSVDFPEPDGPIKATISPRLMFMSTPFKT